MKKIRNTKIGMLLLLLFMLTGCDKFLNVEPTDSLSGNNFWKSETDAETFTLEVYRLFRQGIGIERPTILAGDLRCAPVLPPEGNNPRRPDITLLAYNMVGTAVTTKRVDDGGSQQANTFWVTHVLWNRMDNWVPHYKVIQSANILYDKVPQIAENDASISPATVKRYQAEAVFMRCMTYFMLLRLYGDVPYYTEAYNQKPLGRTSHVQVAKNCIADLAAHYQDLPWTYSDPADHAVRAMRGSALALMMHLNMWCAGFDENNKRLYYEEVDRLGDELRLTGIDQQGAYALLPIEETASIFNGRSKEGLFEIPTNPNYQSNTGNGKEQIENFRRHFVGHVLHAPWFSLNAASGRSELAYEPSYMRLLYPEGEDDRRIEEWFTKGEGTSTANMYGGDYTFVFFKFFNFAYGNSNTEQSVGFSQVIFRIADAILLQAEAVAELGTNDAKAVELLNMIRGRAKAGLYPAVNNYDNNLKAAIFWERCKELMGEGHYFYDLVRSRKILDINYCMHPISYSAFLQGAWTWPINEDVLKNNPYMSLNEYWR
ncbi:RagB/SusD family nutrient uptake outer membrane protein [Sphingobacterium sp. SGG-5]|uniref:RagB/SusD family nutrient uptake outer membrane protein n=1 Tax=Sphingobacterium sp. SGG-5 TaxID=2710881 RepID=UPI0013EB4DB3|nr:RagB/SusD family nutrient uptake outer membrane protein [Sphingobacterium sp. SGG-5]NGM62159.1 RagB/SusD family nutrient uptake outer membrane protein [Sphingobacterium sp. SGG-5]